MNARFEEAPSSTLPILARHCYSWIVESDSTFLASDQGQSSAVSVGLIASQVAAQTPAMFERWLRHRTVSGALRSTLGSDVDVFFILASGNLANTSPLASVAPGNEQALASPITPNLLLSTSTALASSLFPTPVRRAIFFPLASWAVSTAELSSVTGSTRDSSCSYLWESCTRRRWVESTESTQRRARLIQTGAAGTGDDSLVIALDYNDDSTFTTPWLNDDARDYLREHSDFKVTTLAAVRSAVIRAFPQAQIDFEIIVDPEEGWSRLIMNVSTGIDDFDARLESEDSFYSFADSNAEVRDALQHVIVSFR
jgi:hypothetical protein